MLDSQWDESIRCALASAPRSTVFVESRQDLTVEIDSADDPEVTHGFWSGVGAQVGDGRWSYLSDPDPDLLQPLLSVNPPLQGDRDDCISENFDPAELLQSAPAVAAVKSAIVQAQRACPHGRFSARWVEFDQDVRVGCRQLMVADRRRGRRVRLDGYLGTGARVARATVERTLGPSETSLEPVVSDLVERLGSRRASVAPLSGATRIVFAPSIAGILVHELVGHASEADRILRGESWLGPGTHLFSPQLTVVDDPRRGRAPWKFDDEAVASRPVALIREGKSKEFIHSRRTASGSDVAPNGHGRRTSYREAILPRMGCTFVANGRSDPDGIIADVDSGIYVRRMESAHTDPASGRAVFRVTDADRIRGGRIEHALTEHLLETVAEEALAGIESIGDDLAFDHCVGSCHRDGQTLATSVGAPTICIRLMTVRF